MRSLPTLKHRKPLRDLTVNRYVRLVPTKPHLILTCEDNQLSSQSREIFESKRQSFNSIAVEVGSGSGQHLIGHAARNPDTLFIGFELRFKRLFRTAEKAEQQGLKNLLVIQRTGAVLVDLFEAGSLETIFVLFPDPWAKRRWKKHRLINEHFLTEAAHLLKPNGRFIFKTDHEEYFDETLAIVPTLSQFDTEFVTRDLHRHPTPPLNIPSEFENLFVSKGLPVFRLDLQKNRKNAETAV